MRDAGFLDGRARTNGVCAALLLAFALVSGGSSQETGVGVFVLQLFSLPAIAWAAWQHLATPGQRWPWPWWMLAIALLALPLLQLLPLPAPLAAGDGRALLQEDLARFGVAAPGRWTLAPSATWAAVFVLLPALAIFLLVLAMPSRAQRGIAWVVVALAVLSLVLGILQLGAPRESVLNPYPQWQPAMNGFFANPNHQATLLVVASTLAAAHLITVLAIWPTGRPLRLIHAVGAASVILLALAALPLTGSRAGVILSILSCAVVVACVRPLWRSRRGGALLLASLAAAVLAVFVALRWMRVEAIDALRAPLRAVSGDIAARFAPWGSGVGSYVPVFEQEAPPPMLMSAYVNHAHNEYVQWWMEAGLPAVVVLLIAALAMATTARRLWAQPLRTRVPGLAAWVALLAILAHSLVDYPLRTPGMLAVAAALAAIALRVARDDAPLTARAAG